MLRGQVALLCCACSGAASCAKGTSDATYLTDDASLGEGDAGAGLVDASPQVIEPDAASSDAGDGELVPPERRGLYAVRRVYRRSQSVEALVDASLQRRSLMNTHRVYSVATLGADGSFSEALCAIQIDSRDAGTSMGELGALFSYAPALFDHFVPLPFSLELDRDGWAMSATFSAFGWRAVSTEDPLPLSADDVRVFDQDGDGHPGVTLHLAGALFGGGALYVVERMKQRASGTFSGDLWVGALVDESELHVLGGTLSAVTETSAAVASDSDQIVLVKQPELTCAELLAAPAAVFPAHPVAP